MKRFTMSNMALLMSNKLAPREIERIVDQLDIQLSDNLVSSSPDQVIVAGVQLPLRRYLSLTDYILDMNQYVADAVERRAHLVCLPACAGLLPCLLPQFEGALSSLKARPEGGRLDAAAIREFLSIVSDYVFEAFSTTFSRLAARHGIYIMAGSVFCFEGDELRHRSLLFSDLGDLVGYQDKLSLTALETELQVSPSSELRLFETQVGSFSILADSDAHYFELARIAKNQGAKILLGPAVCPESFTPIKAALGLSLRVQETGLYGVQSMLLGDSRLGFALEGTARILAPADLTKNKSGVLAQSSGRLEPDLAVAKLDLHKLSSRPAPYNGDKNPELLRKYIDRLY